LNDLLISAVPASTIIMVLVQVAKKIGMRSEWSPVLAILLGVSYTGAAYVVRIVPGTRGVYEALGTGITLGLTASGLYSGSKAMFTRAIPRAMAGRAVAHATVDAAVIELGTGPTKQ
jgi:hypothetical protein